eukprot:SAG22_NODE_1178_length_5239_cov_67.095136_2_plen_228_part_00
MLYKTFATFNPHTCETPECSEQTSGGEAVLEAVITFLYIFLGSLFIGCLIAALSSLVFKHTSLYHDEFFVTENGVWGSSRIACLPTDRVCLPACPPAAECADSSRVVTTIGCANSAADYLPLHGVDACRVARALRHCGDPFLRVWDGTGAHLSLSLSLPLPPAEQLRKTTRCQPVPPPSASSQRTVPVLFDESLGAVLFRSLSLSGSSTPRSRSPRRRRQARSPSSA